MDLRTLRMATVVGGHPWRFLAPAVVVGIVLAGGCGDEEAPLEPSEDLCPKPISVRASLASGRASPIDLTPSPYDAEFVAAGAEFDVPAAVLKSVGWVETRWQMVEGAEEFPGQPPAFGVMALRGDRLERAAALAGVATRAARREPIANIRAAAALLDVYAQEAEIDRSRPDAWADVLGRFSGIELERGRGAYSRLAVQAMTRGVRQQVALRSDPASAGVEADPCIEILQPPDSEPPPPPPPPPPPAQTDYEPAIWRPSLNFNARSGEMHLVIIHTCEGGYTGCWSWLVNPVSQVSSHYVVDEEGTEISQLVRERDRAWHIAARYDCQLNHGHDCELNGIQSNHITVGIEHAGFASQAVFPASQIEASAALVCDITRDRDIPRDWQHVVGHGQLQPENRTDPGPNWPWVDYLHSIQRHCGEVVVDDDGGLNDPPVATVDVPEGWTASNMTVDYYGNGYHWASTAEDATDGVGFAFFVEALDTLAIDARWTSGTNRSPRAEYLVVDAAGDTLAALRLDQTSGGGAWHELGRWEFPVGWNRVMVMRRDTPGFVVVADALRTRTE